MRAGIIIGSTVLINWKAMGDRVVCSVLVTVGKKESKQVIEQVISYIRKLPFRIPTIYFDPKNRIGLIASLHDISELSTLKECIKRNRFVIDVRIDVWTVIKNLPERVDLHECQGDTVKSTAPVGEGYKGSFEIDDIDRQIIMELMHDSMQPFGKLAKKTGISVHTASRRYKKLVDHGIIRPVIQLDLPKLGYFANVSFALAYSGQTEPNEVIRSVLEIKNNYLVIRINGEYDMLIHILLKDLNQLLSAQKQIAEIPGISRSEMLIYPVFSPWPGIGEYIST